MVTLPMALTNAMKQEAYRRRRAVELQVLRERDRQARLAPTEASIGHLLEGLIEQLNRRPPKERVQAITHIARRCGIVVEEVEPDAL